MQGIFFNKNQATFVLHFHHLCFLGLLATHVVRRFFLFSLQQRHIKPVKTFTWHYLFLLQQFEVQIIF